MMPPPGPLPVSRALLADWPLPLVTADGDKGSRGQVTVAGGCPAMAGAILLTAEACLRSGAGRVRIISDGALTMPLSLAMPEAWVGTLPEIHASAAADDAANAGEALVVGPGAADAVSGSALLERCLHAYQPCPTVIDALALCGVRNPALRARLHGRTLVLTPHMGEMAMLTGLDKAAILASPWTAAIGLATALAAVVMLKGARTWVAVPDGRGWLVDAGSIGLATAGSGDVLAGIVGGLLAQGADGAQAAVWAAYLHACCGSDLARRHGRLGLLARDLLPLIPQVRSAIEKTPRRTRP